MATTVIRCSVVSSTAGRRNLCDSLVDLNLIAPKTPKASYSTCCSCLRCHSVRQSGHTYVRDTLPVEYHDQPLSAGSLGTLSSKQSPILGLGSSHFSLRSATPSYAERKPEIDLCAIEALHTSSVQAKEMPAARSNMDINRNNGYLYNGVSMGQAGELRLYTYITSTSGRG